MFALPHDDEADAMTSEDPLPPAVYLPSSTPDDVLAIEIASRRQALREAELAILTTRGDDEAYRLAAIASLRLSAAIRRRQQRRP